MHNNIAALERENVMGLKDRESKLKLQREKMVKKGFSGRLYGQILLSIPKHLLKITLLVVIGSFIGMLCLINSDKSLSDFLAEEEMDFS